MKPQDQERFYDLRFPLKGIVTSFAYTQQPDGTTVRATNVRAFDAGTARARGGTRAGLSPFFGAGSTAQVSGFHLVQSLSVIVTADAGAT